MPSRKLIASTAAALAAAAIAVGAYAVGSSSSGATTASAAGVAPPGPAPGGQAPQTGQVPQGRGGFGTPVTGATAQRAAKAATARFPGSVEQVGQLADGSYVVDVITSNGELHVAVSKLFAVTGSEPGGPRGGTPPQGAPDGSATPQAPPTPPTQGGTSDS